MASGAAVWGYGSRTAAGAAPWKQAREDERAGGGGDFFFKVQSGFWQRGFLVRGQNGVERGPVTRLTRKVFEPGHAVAVMSVSVPRHSSSFSQVLNHDDLCLLDARNEGNGASGLGRGPTRPRHLK